MAKRRRHGLMIPTRVPSVAPQPTDAAAPAIASVAVSPEVSISSRSPGSRAAGSSSTKVELVLALFGLRAHQPAIGAVAADQLGVPAGLDDAPLVEHQDAVGADHARQPMRQDQGRASGREAVDRLLDHRLVFGVDRGESLVEDQDRRIAQQRAGDRQALALPAGQHDPALADHRRITLRQGHDELVRVGVARRGFELLPVGVRLAEPQILLDRAVEEIRVLMDDGDHPAQRLGVERLQIVAADPHRSALRVEEAQQQARDRGFARAAGADDADLLAGGDGEGEPVMGGTAPAGIGEIDILEGDGREEWPARPGSPLPIPPPLAGEEGWGPERAVRRRGAR